MQDDELKKMLEHLEVPPPSQGAQERAVNLAMANFTEQQKNKPQGFAGALRPIHEAAYGLRQWIRRISMKKAYIIAGSLASVTLLLSITTSHYSPFLDIVPVPVKTPEATTTTAMPSTDILAQQPLPEADKAEYKPVAPEPAPPPVVADMKQAAKPAERKKDSEGLTSNAASSVQAAAPMAIAGGNAAPVKEERSDTNLYAVKKQAFGGEAKVRMIAPGSPPASDYYQPAPQYSGNDKFESFKANSVKLVSQEPVSTFSIDADTASYSFVRRALNGGALPQKDAVRVEEMINYFSYDYALPESKSQPFKPTVTVYQTPWNKDTKLMHIGIKGYDIAKAEKPRSNLVFLIDISGSMSSQDKLPLAKNALRMLIDQLGADDTIGIVTYAGNAGTALEPTKVSDKHKILAAIDSLGAGGSTAGAQGIEQAYALAQSHYNKNGVNRVILATDGDFNVGMTDSSQLQTLIEQKRQSGIFLSILGFGQGNYNDALMQKLAQHGNGTAAYIDTLNEARKVLVEEAGSTLFTIAKDVKIQVEFNPMQVAEYRLVGYESRLLNREDFNNDKVDAGEVGAGHAVTAIYEITPVGNAPQSDPLRYGQEQKPVVKQDGQFSGEYAFLKMRYKLPNESASKLLTTPIDEKLDISYCPKDAQCELMRPSDDVRFATAVAAFGQLLKGDAHIKTMSYDDIITLADGARGKDTFGYRAEFVNLVRLAKSLQGGQMIQPQVME